METKHTQGEWLIEGQKIVSKDGTAQIADISLGVKNQSMHNPYIIEQEKANAKLIAAAPELLETCLMLLKEYADVEMNTPIAYFKVIDRAKEAIKKATE